MSFSHPGQRYVLRAWKGCTVCTSTPCCDSSNVTVNRARPTVRGPTRKTPDPAGAKCHDSVQANALASGWSVQHSDANSGRPGGKRAEQSPSSAQPEEEGQVDPGKTGGEEGQESRSRSPGAPARFRCRPGRRVRWPGRPLATSLLHPLRVAGSRAPHRVCSTWRSHHLDGAGL